MGNPGPNHATSAQQQHRQSGQQGSDAQSPEQQDADKAKHSLRHGQKGGSEVREDRGIADETNETDESDQTHVYDEALSRATHP